MGFLVCIVYVTSVDWGVYFSVNSLLALVGVCHTSVNPGRCKEEAWVQGHAATGSVKTHFSNTQVHSCFASNSILQPAKKRLTTHMRLENCAKKASVGGWGKLSVWGLFVWKCTWVETQSFFKMSTVRNSNNVPPKNQVLGYSDFVGASPIGEIYKIHVANCPYALFFTTEQPPYIIQLKMWSARLSFAFK